MSNRVSYSHGGKIADYPDHAKTRVPESERQVSISITTWKESCCGAMHFYPSITLGAVYFFDPKENVYRRCWDDPFEYTGRRINPDMHTTDGDGFPYTYDEKKAEGFITVERAKEWLDYMIAKLDLTSRIADHDKTAVQQEVDYWTGK